MRKKGIKALEYRVEERKSSARDSRIKEKFFTKGLYSEDIAR
jgi:hypothetical protein